MKPEGVLVHDVNLGQVSHEHAFEQALLIFWQGRLVSNPCCHVGRRRHDDVLAGERLAVEARHNCFVRFLLIQNSLQLNFPGINCASLSISVVLIIKYFIRGSITVRLNSSLSGLDSTKQVYLLLILT